MTYKEIEINQDIVLRPRLLTGDRPTGKLHLGHYVGSLLNRVALQKIYDTYIIIADVQALTDHFDHPLHIVANVIEVAKDYLSVGIDPHFSTIFIQSQIPEIHELATYYLNLVSLARLERNPTLKAEIQDKGYDRSLPMGFLCYPIHQAADITIFQASCVPVGEDQIPMIEQANEIVRRFNRTYNTQCLKICQAHLSSTSRLVGIDGVAKASKSLGNAIFLSDTPDIIKEKVFQMYTDPLHVRVTDPGRVEGNVVFSYLDAFCQDSQKEELEAWKAHYRKGGLGDTFLKTALNDILQERFAPIREKRNALRDGEVWEIIKEGTKRARHVAQCTMEEVRKAMGLRYF
ncbi:tryptophan--tRNA ligase [Holospora curviuscula]|uniref:Tryptophan--tRNA ligase n=1 Tax=Holospora curviuscula TaxID=1082868 RepID=A0A2S5R971_9PROT|nr:tryptophan--tRNA ligase [Holospora curviuscula]PPE03675.1 Tryptophan--tRNA ligase 2 [Holospora curviuscula]